jgi:Uma2 family endonuclease
MGITRKIEPLSIEAYLRGEQHTDVRHEYIAGQVYAMVGASKLHNLISGSLYAHLRDHLRGSACRVYMSDMKVRVEDAFYYPDIVVSCAEADPGSLYETEPILITEVLSESTEARDRFEKRLAYQRIPSLREYVLVEQRRVRIGVYRRQDDGWTLDSLGIGDTLRLDSVCFECPSELLYEDVLNSMEEE